MRRALIAVLVGAALLGGCRSSPRVIPTSVASTATPTGTSGATASPPTVTASPTTPETATPTAIPAPTATPTPATYVPVTGVVRIAGGAPLSPPPELNAAAWSPDSTRLAGLDRASGGVMVVTIPALGATRINVPGAREVTWIANDELAIGGVDGRVTPIVDGFAYAYSWSPDGSRVALSHGTDLWVAPADGSVPPTPVLADGVHGNVPARWSPDGRWLQFTPFFGGFGACE